MSNCMGLKVQFDTVVNYMGDYDIKKTLMDSNWAKEENPQDEEGFNRRLNVLNVGRTLLGSPITIILRGYDRQHDNINVEKI